MPPFLDPSSLFSPFYLRFPLSLFKNSENFDVVVGINAMPKTNGIVFSYAFLLVSTSLFSQKSVAAESLTVREQSLKRPDPLRHFKLYRGGYDIWDKHYWASAAFTGVHGYAIAGVWMLCGLGFGSYLILKICSGGSPSTLSEHSDSSYRIIFLLVLLFSLLAIVATGLVMAANQNSLGRTEKLKRTILGAGADVRKTIQNVTEAMTEMQNLLLPYDGNTCRLLNLSSHQLGRESRIIRSFIRKNEHSINEAIRISYIVNLVVVSVNLAFLVTAIALLLLHWQPGFIILILLCWIFTTLCWFLTGIDFFFNTFAEDTCSALEDFERNPQNSSLNSVLPCSNYAFADKVLVDIGYAVHTFIAGLNTKIAQLKGSLNLNEQNHEEDSLRTVQQVCDPFLSVPNFTYAPEKCPKDSISIGDLPNVISRFTCHKENENAGRCESDGRFIPEASFVLVRAYSSAIELLIGIYPDLQSLIQCSFVKDTFSNVVLHQCRPLRASTRKLWVALLCLSSIMVVLVLLWVAKAYQDRGRSFSLCSIIPNANN